MRILTFTNLYPNAVQPRHGIFVENRMRQLAAVAGVSIRVVAPVPCVPKVARPLAGQYAVLADVPQHESRHDIGVWHPRFMAVPRLTGWLNPVSMALCALPLLRRLQREQDFDLIDAHFMFPDGAAAALLGEWLDKPVAITARGTDLNVFPRYRIPRAWIGWAARRAAALVAVSQALKDTLVLLGIPDERVAVMRNGVDLSLFSPQDRAAARRELGLSGRVLISVGHLVPDKGHQLVIQALQDLPDVTLLVAGDGPMRAELSALSERLGVAGRVKWCGTLPQQQLARHYAAADATVLASKMEGMPNVLLESLACGTPVIATDVGGIAEVVSSADAGVLIRERTADAIVRAVRGMDLGEQARERARRHAGQFGWQPTTEGLLDLFEAATARTSAPGRDMSVSRRTA